MSDGLAGPLRALLASGEPAVLVVVERAQGSTPREAGVAMLVTRQAELGTIGGGRLEWEAARAARELLDSGARESRLDLPLGPEIGQCCGGRVLLRLSRPDADTLEELEALEQREEGELPTVLLFGAGHVGKAIAAALAPLPLRLRWIDERAAMFPRTLSRMARIVVSETLALEVARAPRGAAVLALTHSHAQDFLVVEAALRRTDLAYVGLIGSATKRARFVRGLRELDIAPGLIDGLVCPIGGSLRDKRPAVIAALVTAELLLAFARSRDGRAGSSA